MDDTSLDDRSLNDSPASSTGLLEVWLGVYKGDAAASDKWRRRRLYVTTGEWDETGDGLANECRAFIKKY